MSSYIEIACCQDCGWELEWHDVPGYGSDSGITYCPECRAAESMKTIEVDEREWRDA